MLNLLAVLQELASPIKKEKVDLITVFNAKTSPIDIRDDEAKINCSKEKFLEWMEIISEEFLKIILLP
jgi:hypothetical protein